MKSLRRLTVALVLASTSVVAQQPTPAVVGSTLSGRVVCADTNAPARFARVLFKPVDGTTGGFGSELLKGLQGMMPGGKSPSEEQQRSMAAATHAMNQATDMMNASTVGLSGEYSFAGLKAGTYYIHVMMPGYVDPLAQFTDEELASTDPAVRARIAAAVPTVTLSGTDSAHLDLRIVRGAVVTGRLVFDDGTPAVGWSVSVVKPGSPDEPVVASTMAHQMLMFGGSGVTAMTGDLGQYRLSGLPPGQYAVRAVLNATAIGISVTNVGDGGSGINIAVYSGNTFSRADAKAFTVTAGETHPDINISIPEHSLHNITGHVYAKSDSHPLNTGDVMLTSKNNPAYYLKAAIRDDGSFRFEYLPAGPYTIKVEAAADSRSTGSNNLFGMSIPKQETLRKYTGDSTEITLSDSSIDSVSFNLAQTDWTPPVKKAGKNGDVSPGAALGALLDSLGGDNKDDSGSNNPTDKK